MPRSEVRLAMLAAALIMCALALNVPGAGAATCPSQSCTQYVALCQSDGCRARVVRTLGTCTDATGKSHAELDVVCSCFPVIQACFE